MNTHVYLSIINTRKHKMCVEFEGVVLLSHMTYSLMRSNKSYEFCHNTKNNKTPYASKLDAAASLHTLSPRFYGTGMMA